MSKQITNLQDSDKHTVFVGAHIPLRLYYLLVEEAEGAGVPRSEVLRRMLAERYGHQQGAREEEGHNEP